MKPLPVPMATSRSAFSCFQPRTYSATTSPTTRMKTVASAGGLGAAPRARATRTGAPTAGNIDTAIMAQTRGPAAAPGPRGRPSVLVELNGDVDHEVGAAEEPTSGDLAGEEVDLIEAG